MSSGERRGKVAGEPQPPRRSPFWFWLSFADEDGFRGVIITDVDVDDPILAVRKTHALGINPGGQVRMFLMDENLLGNLPRNELMDLETMHKLGFKTQAEHEIETN